MYAIRRGGSHSLGKIMGTTTKLAEILVRGKSLDTHYDGSNHAVDASDNRHGSHLSQIITRIYRAVTFLFSSRCFQFHTNKTSHASLSAQPVPLYRSWKKSNQFRSEMRQVSFHYPWFCHTLIPPLPPLSSSDGFPPHYLLVFSLRSNIGLPFTHHAVPTS